MPWETGSLVLVYNFILLDDIQLLAKMILLDQSESKLAAYRKYQLANGMTVIVAQRPHTGTFTICTELNVGMRDGGPHLAHLVEHRVMAHVDRICKRPEYLNAFTHFTKTRYWLSAHLDEFDSGLEMVKRVLLPLEANKKQVQGEISILASEFMEAGRAQMIFDQEHYRVLGGDDLSKRYRKEIDGVRLKIGVKAVNDFHETHYQPRNAVVAIVSPLNPEEVVARLDGVLADVANSNEPTEEIAGASSAAIRKRFHARWYHAITSVGVWHKMSNVSIADRVALKFLNSILGGKGRLFNEIRMKNSLCYNVNSHFEVFENTALHSAFVNVSRRNAGRASQLMHEVIEGVTAPLSKEDFDEAIIAFAQQCDVAEESKWDLLAGLLDWNAGESRLLPPNEIKKMVLGLTAEQLAAAGKRFFSAENRYWLISGGFWPMAYFKIKQLSSK